MGKTYFMTGFPGFISKHLLTQLIGDHQDIDTIYLLVHPTQIIEAQRVLALVIRTNWFPLEKIDIIEGDITKSDLDVPYSFERTDITHVFHLAAIYNLAVSKEVAYSINVEGTKNINAFCRTLPHLERYIYFSTAYVSGKSEGLFTEQDLIKGQSFRNYYEETKYAAEVDVQSHMNNIPTTIIRPSIVVGHSLSGETSKFDGPYYILRFFHRFRFFPIPYIGKSNQVTNFVPVDYIVKATSYLSRKEEACNSVCHLVDPHPLKVEETYALLLDILLKKQPTGRIPFSLVQRMLSLKVVRQFVDVEKEVLDYFLLHSIYDCRQTLELLEEINLTPPSFTEVAPTMVEYFHQFKLDDSKKTRII